MKYYAIIVAGGSGQRMKTEIPKQFLLVNKLPVLMHTINAFAQCKSKPEIFVVLPQTDEKYWAELCERFEFSVPHTVVFGGKERFDSVKNALSKIDGDGLVAIHDGVRAMVSPDLIDRCYSEALKSGNAVPALSASDSVREKKLNQKSSALNRREIFLIQTPQTFHLVKLKEAYNQNFDPSFTDDASVVEASGSEIFLTPGERENIKITFPRDLDFAKSILHKEPTNKSI